MGAVGEVGIRYINPQETNRPETDWQVPRQHPARCECAESGTEKPERPAGGAAWPPRGPVPVLGGVQLQVGAKVWRWGWAGPCGTSARGRARDKVRAGEGAGQPPSGIQARSKG